MKLDEIRGATVRPKDNVKVETDNAVNVILTKDDLVAMIDAIDVVYNLIDDKHTAHAHAQQRCSGVTGIYGNAVDVCWLDLRNYPSAFKHLLITAAAKHFSQTPSCKSFGKYHLSQSFRVIFILFIDHGSKSLMVVRTDYWLRY